MNLLDRMIAAVAPETGLRRAAAREALAVLSTSRPTNRYEAARPDRSLDGWLTTGADANAEIGGQLSKIWARTRDLARNEPYVARAYDILAAKMVGTGIRPRLGDGVPDQTRNRTMDSWKAFVDEADIEGENDFYSLEALAARCMVESGAALFRYIPLPGAGRRVPWAVQLLEPDWIDRDQHRMLDDGGVIIHGVEFDALGRRRAYWLHTQHPGADLFTTRAPSSVRVPAAMIAHLFRPQRPGQVHGVPWAAPIAARVKHLDDVNDARLKRAKIQACFAAFVRKNDAATPLGASATVDGKRREQLAPGIIEYLRPDEDVTFGTPPRGEDDSAWMDMIVHGISAGLGVTYAQMTGDLSDANYSSMRAGSIDQWDLLSQWQKLILVPKMCRPTWRMFDRVEGTRQTRLSILPVEWDFPERTMIDPQKDGEALDASLVAGRRTFHEVIAARGLDPEMHIAELRRERSELTGLDLPHISKPPAPTSGDYPPAEKSSTNIQLRAIRPVATMSVKETEQMQKRWFECRRTSAKTAAVMIYDEIGAWGLTAKDFIEELKGLGEVDVLTVSINSGGGDVFDGLAIYNALRRHSAAVEVQIDGIAASIASVIAMAGNSIEMPENAWMMIHDPSGMVMGTARDMEKMAETLVGIKKSLVGIYQRRTGRDAADIETMMADETYMDGPAALAEGFVDRVTDGEAVAATIDLDRFNHVPAPVKALFGRGSAASQPSGRKEFSMPDKKSPAPAAEEQPNIQDTESGGESRKPAKDRAAIVDDLAGKPAGHETKPQRPGQWMDPKPSDPSYGQPSLTEADVQARAEKLARQKMDRIQAVYRSAANLGLQAEAQKLIDDGIDPNEIPEILIEVHARRAASESAVRNLAPSGISMGFSHDDPNVLRERISDAIAARYLNKLMKVPDASRQYMAWQPQDIMRHLLENAGVDTRRMTRSAIVDSALHSTSDFPNLLAASANKIFLGSYEAAPATFRSIAGRVDLSNFQTHNLLRDGDFPTLLEVLEDGEIKSGTISESKETAQLKTSARTFGITRHSLVNDSLGVFGRMVFKMGQAVARYENKTVWAIITANGAMSDGDALFHANHGNLTASGTAISATSLGVGRAAMRVQASLDGETLNIAPAVLVVPAAKETLAEQTLSALVIPAQPSNLTPASLRQLLPVTEPILDAASTTAWYLFADPSMGACVVYGYLEGDTAPRIRSNDPFNKDGIEFQVRLDFYAAAADWRFGYKNAGA